MLVVRAIEDQPERGIRKGEEYCFYIVDAHHHMGKEKSHRNTPSSAYEYYNLLWFDLMKMAKVLIEDDKLLFEPIRVVPPPILSKILDSRKEWSQFNHGWLIDRTVVFPYTDDYYRKGFPKVASFNLSNDRIAGWSTRPPHSIRLIGFARVDPSDESVSKDMAIKELTRSVRTLGLRGLKIHPLAQLFIDEIEDESTIRIIESACKMQIPVIVDTRSIRTAEKISRVVEDVRERVSASEAQHLCIILAHCAMSPDDKRLYKILRDPAIFGETSSLHGHDVPVLFQMAPKLIKGRDTLWSNKLLFGTDYSFLTVQATDVILHLLSRSFTGTLSDIQKILGGNALQLIQQPIGFPELYTRNPILVTFPDTSAQIIDSFHDFLFSMLSGNEWSLVSLDYSFPEKGSWSNPDPISKGGNNGVGFNSSFFTFKSKKTTEARILWLRQFSERATSVAILPMGSDVALASFDETWLASDSTLISSLSRNSIVVASIEELIQKISSEFK